MWWLRGFARGAQCSKRIRRDHRAGFSRRKGLAAVIADSEERRAGFFRAHGVFSRQARDYFFIRLLFKKVSSAAQDMFNAVSKRNLALRDDADATYSNFAWNRQVWEEQQAVLGADPWKFAFKGNEKALTRDSLCRRAGAAGEENDHPDLFIQIDETAIVKETSDQHGNHYADIRDTAATDTINEAP